MPRRAKGLTATQVEKGTKPGRYGDGVGLYLLVRSKAAKFWVFRYVRHGRMREMGLGPAVGRTAVSLADARVKARALHEAIRQGRDPLEERDREAANAKANATKAKARAITFRQVMDLYLTSNESGWRSQKHRRQWETTVATYALPTLGDLPVADVDMAAVTRILEPLWKSRTETASRLRGRLERILDYARVRGWRDGENPARWRGNLDHILPRRAKAQLVQHHAALPWQVIGPVMQKLRTTDSIPARCLGSLILTAVRSGEARGASWSEIDMAQRVWTIPAQRTKAHREHRIPLSDAALDVLRVMLPLRDEHHGDWVFPGARVGRPIGDVVMVKALVAAGGRGVVHGLRSTFRDWCAEWAGCPRELAEKALAHALSDAVEAAYQRGDMFERRRRLMAEWAAFCDRQMVVGEVVPLRAAV